MAANNINATVTIGGAISGAFRSAVSAAKHGLGGIGAEMERLSARQKELNSVLKAQERLGRSANMATVGAATAELQQLERQISLLREKNRLMDRARSMMDRGRAMMGSGAKMIGAVGVAGATLGLPVRAAAQQQTAALGIAKQFEGMRDASGKLTTQYHQMIGEVQQLARTTPIATNDLLQMTAAAGQMGIARDKAVGFVRTTAMMAAAFELPAEQLAEDAGKIAGVYNLPIESIGDLADSVNYLSDNTLAKGGEIIDVLKRIGGVAAALKMNEKDAAALGATMVSLGSTSETASTAINASLTKLASAGTSAKLGKTLSQLGFDAKEVQANMVKDAKGTLISVLEAINKLPESERIAMTAQLFGAEHGDDLAKLAGRVDLLKKNIELANSEEAKGSMKREFDAGNETAEKQYQTLQNVMQELSTTIGNMLLPALGKLMAATATVVGGVTTFIRQNEGLVRGLGAAAITFGTVVGALGTVKLGIGAVTLAWGALKLAFAANPVGLAVAAVAAAAGAIYANWEPIKWFFNELWDGVKTAFAGAATWIEGAWVQLKDMIGQGVAWATEKIQPVIGMIQRVTDWFGSDESKAQPEQPAASAEEKKAGWWDRLWGNDDPPAPPPLPAVSPARQLNQTNQVTINVQQLPGEDQEALARRIVEIQRRHGEIRARGTLFDAAQPAY